jgi:hypothetical protein
MINPKLKIGDRVQILHMEDEMDSVPMGTWGEVTRVSTVMGEDIYGVKWDNGQSLNILSTTDVWDTEENRGKFKKKKITEQDETERHNNLYRNIDVFTNFKMRYLHEYLKKVRDCGVVNMYQAAPFLYMGKDRMEHFFRYQDIENEICEEVLDMANMAQHEMVTGVIKVLESQGKEDSLEIINRYLQRYSQKVLENYINLF